MSETKDEFERVLQNLDSEDVVEADLIDDSTLGDLLPKMVVNASDKEEEECIIADEELRGIYNEVLDNCRKDRDMIDTYISDFKNLVFNDTESSSSSAKEGLVNLIKMKTDMSDKMSKVADLMTRLKMKSKDTFPRYLAAHQHNNVKIENTSKRDLIRKVEGQK